MVMLYCCQCSHFGAMRWGWSLGTLAWELPAPSFAHFSIFISLFLYFVGFFVHLGESSLLTYMYHFPSFTCLLLFMVVWSSAVLKQSLILIKPHSVWFKKSWRSLMLSTDSLVFAFLRKICDHLALFWYEQEPCSHYAQAAVPSSVLLLCESCVWWVCLALIC
jgi:hypothetical protein